MKDPIDPRGLIREAYVIDGISAPECRSIFFDWALGQPADADTKAFVRELLIRYAAEVDHPMTAVLRAALDDAIPTRRGGRAGRMQG